MILLTSILLIVLLLVLFFLRQLIAKNIIISVARITGHRRAGIIAYSLIFLPGVIIHELSHFFTASLLAVRTGRITIFPESQEKGHRLGSVQLAQTDFIRTSLIGLAPLLWGSLAIIALSHWRFTPLFKATDIVVFFTTLRQAIIPQLTTPLSLLSLYLIFVIANTMFTSSSDLKSLPLLVAFLVFIILILVGLGQAQALPSLLSRILLRPLQVLVSALAFSVVVNLLLFLPLALFHHLTKTLKF
jgi:hypothetical protein